MEDLPKVGSLVVHHHSSLSFSFFWGLAFFIILLPLLTNHFFKFPSQQVFFVKGFQVHEE